MLTIDLIDMGLPKAHRYLLGAVGPRPICFASTVDEKGVPNLAPFSFFNVFSSNPPIAVFSPSRSGRTGAHKDTYNNVKKVNGEFTSVWHNESLSNLDRWKGWREVFESTWLD